MVGNESSEKIKDPIKGLMEWSRDIKLYLNESLAQKDVLGAGLIYDLHEKCKKLWKDHHVIVNVLVMANKKNIKGTTPKNNTNIKEILNALMTPLSTDSQKKVNTQNYFKNLMGILNTHYKSNSLWEHALKEGQIIFGVSSKNNIKNKILIKGDSIKAEAIAVEYDIYNINVPGSDCDENQYPQIALKKATKNGILQYPPQSDEDNAEKIAEAYKHVVISTKACYGAGVPGVTVAAVIGIGGNGFLLDKDKDKIINFKKLIALESIIDVSLDIGLITAEKLFHNIDPFSEATPQGRIAFGQFSKAIEKLGKLSYDVFSDILKQRNQEKADKAVTYQILRLVGQQYKKPAKKKILVKHLLGRTAAKNDFQNDDLVLKLLDKKIIKSIGSGSDRVFFDDSITNEDQLRKHLNQIKGINREEILTVWQQSLQSLDNNKNNLMALSYADYDVFKRKANRLSKEDSLKIFDMFKDKIPQKEDIALSTEILPVINCDVAIQFLDVFNNKLDTLFADSKCEEIKAIWQAAFVLARWPQTHQVGEEAVSLLFNCIKHYDKLFKEQCLIDDNFSKTQRIKDDYNGLLKVLKLALGLLPEVTRKIFIKHMDTDFIKLKMNIKNDPGISKAFFDYVYPKNNYKPNNELDLILLCSQKGGVGKSTIALLIAHELYRKDKKKCLLVEMDFGGSTFGYLDNVEKCLSNYDLFCELSDLSIEELMDKKNMYRVQNTKIEIIYTPLNHEYQATLVARLLILSRSAEIRCRLSDLTSWAGKNEYSHIILDLPAEFGAETMTGFSQALNVKKTKTIIVGRTAFNSIIPTFEWSNKYCLGIDSEVFLLVNKVPSVSKHFWSSCNSISDNIFSKRKGTINGFPSAGSSAFIQALMPWNKVACIGDFTAFREMSKTDDVMREQGQEDITNFIEMITE